LVKKGVNDVLSRLGAAVLAALQYQHRLLHMFFVSMFPTVCTNWSPC
jgi:hypothetical protein